MSASQVLTGQKSPRASITIEARGVSRRFRETVALADVDLEAGAGEIHALLGPNGAGKTTLLRLLTGLLSPSDGTVRVLGLDPARDQRPLRRLIGLVPSGDRSFYLRLSGVENLVFFARLHGMRRAAAVKRSREVLADVGLTDAARVRVGVYSHGMQKRLSVARALLTHPGILLVDEATHDLDPEGAARVRELVGGLAERGTTVVWTTQRVDEIRGFAERVTMLDRGRTRFSGTVAAFIAHAPPRRYLVQLRNGTPSAALAPRVERALRGSGAAAYAPEAGSDHYVLSLTDGAVLGDAIASLAAAEIDVLSCREERSGIEEAFMSLVEERP